VERQCHDILKDDAIFSSDIYRLHPGSVAPDFICRTVIIRRRN